MALISRRELFRNTRTDVVLATLLAAGGLRHTASARWAKRQVLETLATVLAVLDLLATLGKLYEQLTQSRISEDDLRRAFLDIVNVFLSEMQRDIERVQINLQIGDAHIRTATLFGALREYAVTQVAGHPDPDLLLVPHKAGDFRQAKESWLQVGVNTRVYNVDPRVAAFPGFLGYVCAMAIEARAFQALAEFYAKRSPKTAKTYGTLLRSQLDTASKTIAEFRETVPQIMDYGVLMGNAAAFTFGPANQDSPNSPEANMAKFESQGPATYTVGLWKRDPYARGGWSGVEGWAQIKLPLEIAKQQLVLMRAEERRREQEERNWTETNVWAPTTKTLNGCKAALKELQSKGMA